jgi:hypothetical protein
VSYLITATFMGRDGSLGYRYGADYVLIVYPNPAPWTALAIGLRTVQEGNPSGYCPYATFETFLQNWMNVTLVK